MCSHEMPSASFDVDYIERQSFLGCDEKKILGVPRIQFIVFLQFIKETFWLEIGIQNTVVSVADP